MKILEELKKLGIELTEEQQTAVKGKFSEEVISINEHDKKMGKLETERDKFKADYETAKTTLEGFEGKDFDKMTAEVNEWKTKAEQAEKDYKEKLQARDYSDAIKELSKDLKFTSNSAKKAFFADLESNPLQMREGKILGFDDFVKNFDKDAFVTEAKAHKAQFTQPMIHGSEPSEPTAAMPKIF